MENATTFLTKYLVTTKKASAKLLENETRNFTSLAADISLYGEAGLAHPACVADHNPSTLTQCGRVTTGLRKKKLLLQYEMKFSLSG